jgi:phosphatidylserine/phosphatidylglycerophosphate/cardiolipin synthase-like enzyme
MQDRTGQDRTGQDRTGQDSTAQHSTAQHSTAQHSTAQHCTALHCTALHCTALHYIALHYIYITFFSYFIKSIRNSKCSIRIIQKLPGHTGHASRVGHTGGGQYFIHSDGQLIICAIDEHNEHKYRTANSFNMIRQILIIVSLLQLYLSYLYKLLYLFNSFLNKTLYTWFITLIVLLRNANCVLYCM